jgi:hypothetical protein
MIVDIAVRLAENGDAVSEASGREVGRPGAIGDRLLNLSVRTGQADADVGRTILGPSQNPNFGVGHLCATTVYTGVWLTTHVIQPPRHSSYHYDAIYRLQIHLA